MIKINKVPTADFVARYSSYACEKVAWPEMQKVITLAPAADKKALKDFFTKEKLHELITLSAADLECVARDVYSRFPALAERYCYGLLLESVDTSMDIGSLSLTDSSDIKQFDAMVRRVLGGMRAIFNGSSNLPLTRNIIGELSSAKPRYQKRRLLNKLKAAGRGTHTLRKHELALFAPWVNALERCFNYDRMADYMMELDVQLGVKYCPYCGIESLGEHADRGSHPGFDHFYPRSRFPFLALTISNLLPAGDICNQKVKRNKSMLGCAHPALHGLENDQLFSFGYNPDGAIEETLSIGLHTLSSECKQRNVEVFKLGDAYHKNTNLRKWFATTHNSLNIIKELGTCVSALERDALVASCVDLKCPSTEGLAMKFKVDAFNNITDSNLVPVLQTP